MVRDMIRRENLIRSINDIDYRIFPVIAGVFSYPSSRRIMADGVYRDYEWSMGEWEDADYIMGGFMSEILTVDDGNISYEICENSIKYQYEGRQVHRE